MFKSLRLNSQIYIFHKDIPTLEVGQVVSVSLPKPKYAVPPSFGQLQEMVVDITARINGSIINYSALPADQDIADSYSNGEGIALSDSREAMNAEIIACKLKSIDIINSVENHKKMISSFDQILQDLNPEYAEKQQQQSEINTLKSLMTDMNKTLTTLTSMILKLTKEDKK